VLLRPEGTPAPGPDDLAFAVPVGPKRPVVLVGAPGDEAEVAPRDVVDLLAALSPRVRSTVLLAPGRNLDLLPAGQPAADTFGAEVETLTGAPLMIDDPVPGTGAHLARTVLIGADGAPAWRPFVEAVVCRPSAGGPPVPIRNRCGGARPVMESTGQSWPGDSTVDCRRDRAAIVRRSSLEHNEAVVALRRRTDEQSSGQGLGCRSRTQSGGGRSPSATCRVTCGPRRTSWRSPGVPRFWEHQAPDDVALRAATAVRRREVPRGRGRNR